MNPPPSAQLRTVSQRTFGDLLPHSSTRKKQDAYITLSPPEVAVTCASTVALALSINSVTRRRQRCGRRGQWRPDALGCDWQRHRRRIGAVLVTRGKTPGLRPDGLHGAAVRFHCAEPTGLWLNASTACRTCTWKQTILGHRAGFSDAVLGSDNPDDPQVAQPGTKPGLDRAGCLSLDARWRWRGRRHRLLLSRGLLSTRHAARHKVYKNGRTGMQRHAGRQGRQVHAAF
jgi:hypothetical protein